MKHLRPTQGSPASAAAARGGFTLVELLTVIAIVAVLAAILLPTLSNARERSNGMFCLNNTRQLTMAWLVYGEDHEGGLPYNLTMTEVSGRTNINWVNNVMSWDALPNSDNTNLATITKAALGPYADNPSIYHCPSDRALSPAQRAASWPQRIRSYAMNAMVGDGGPATASGANINNPGYKQFLKIEQIPRPTEILVFLDENADSIDDGCFLNKVPVSGGYTWNDLPAAYHNRAGAISFADGHAALHIWTRGTTFRPSMTPGVNLPTQNPDPNAGDNPDFDWVIDHMSIAQGH